jgi:E3 ubiquitin-protein ligase HUWE1
LKGKLKIKFVGEEGVDAGGLTREFFLLLSRAIFNPNYALFAPSADNANVFMPNKLSYHNPDHLRYFKFVGRIVGKAIYEGERLDCYFTKSFYKHMLGKLFVQ